MPVEIRELIITASVSAGSNNNASVDNVQPVDTKKIIEECVEQVMEIIKEKQQR